MSSDILTFSMILLIKLSQKEMLALTPKMYPSYRCRTYATNSKTLYKNKENRTLYLQTIDYLAIMKSYHINYIENTRSGYVIRLKNQV